MHELGIEMGILRRFFEKKQSPTVKFSASLTSTVFKSGAPPQRLVAISIAATSPSVKIRNGGPAGQCFEQNSRRG